MEFIRFKNLIIQEAYEELSRCFAYDESDLSLDLACCNVNTLKEQGIEWYNNHRVYNVTDDKWLEPPADRLLYVRTIPEFFEYADSFAEKCAERNIEDKQMYILVFMAALFTREIHNLLEDTKADLPLYEWDTYSNAIRPEMLKLYIALEKAKASKGGIKAATIRFDNEETVKVGEHGYPWFHYMMEKHLKRNLGVNSIQEAKEELEDLYSPQKGKRVKSKQRYTNYIIASTYTYISEIIFKSEVNKVTVEKCALLQDFLTSFKFIQPEDKTNNLNNLQSTVRSLVVESESIVIERYRRNRKKKGCPYSKEDPLFWFRQWLDE